MLPSGNKRLFVGVVPTHQAVLPGHRGVGSRRGRIHACRLGSGGKVIGFISGSGAGTVGAANLTRYRGSVRPVGATMEDWINAGSGSIWTQAVKSVVIKWDGGY